MTFPPELFLRHDSTQAGGTRGIMRMDKGHQKPERFTGSMLLVSLGFGTVYWIVDTLLYSLTSADAARSPLEMLISTKGLWQRLIVLCFFIIFGSHIQYTIRKQRETEAALQETEERYRALVETSTDAIISVDEKMRVIQWNRSASDLFGFSKELMMGKSVDILVPDKFKEQHREGVKRFLATGKPSLVGNTAEFEGVRKDGSVRPIEISLSADRDPRGWTFTSIIRETTERRRALEALRESEERYRNLFEDSKDAVMIWTAAGKILGVNQAALDTFGCGGEEMIGSDIAELYADHADLVAFQRKLEQEGAVRGHEIRLKKRNGGLLECLLTATVRRCKDGSILGYQGIVRDVTEMKHNEHELERMLKTLQKSVAAVTQAMSAVVESRDPYTAGHQKRVSALARAIAQEMNLSSDQVAAVRMAGGLHDIGKIAVPSEILTSPAKLSSKAFEIIKDHPQTGYNILCGIEFPWPVADIVLQHHEAMDGSGYPAGLSGDQIKLEARILRVADVVEAMASHRPYRPSLGIEMALEEILRFRGTVFDPVVVDACLTLFREKGYNIV